MASESIAVISITISFVFYLFLDWPMVLNRWVENENFTVPHKLQPIVAITLIVCAVVVGISEFNHYHVSSLLTPIGSWGIYCIMVAIVLSDIISDKQLSYQIVRLLILLWLICMGFGFIAASMSLGVLQYR